MSNHHPGNEWYRRLIRSNRNLYRACPKHTKLLVAKAIVQAVQEQNGRFLERNIQTGMWYTIPYKRAVDKTSQGLREKDRENEGPGGSGSTSGKSKKSKPQIDMKSYLKYPTDQNNNDDDDDDDDDEEDDGDTNETVTNVPYAFSGKGSSTQHNLSELAQVAVQNTTKHHHKKHFSTNSVNAQQFFGATRTNSTGNSSSNNTASAKAPPSSAVAAIPPRLLKSAMKKQSINTAAANLNPVMTNISASINNVGPPPPQMPLVPNNNNIHNNMNHSDVEPLTPAAYAYWLQQQQQLQQLQQQQQINTTNNDPSTVQQAQLLRDISMYRLLKHTQLLPSQTSMLLQMNNNHNIPSGIMNNAGIMDNNNNIHNNNMTAFNSNTGTALQQFHPQQPDVATTVMMMNQSGNSNINNNMNHHNMNGMLQNGVGTSYDPQQQPQPSIYPNNTNHTSHGSNTNSNTGGGTLPVGLTRLTSQVSDWLNFFWPTNNNTSHNGNGNANAQTVMNGIPNNNNSIGTGISEQYANNTNTNHHPPTTVYERQVSADAAAILANRASTSDTMTLRTGTNGIPTPVELYQQQSQQSQQLSAINQQQQQQQTDVTIESLLQLHRQLSNEIDSTPFTSLFRTNSVLSQQTSLPFFLPATSSEQQQRMNVRNDDSNTRNASQLLNVSNSSKRQYQDRDEELHAMNQQQHYRSYRLPIPPEENDVNSRQSKQQKLSHSWNTAIGAHTVGDENNDDTKQPGRASLIDGNDDRRNIVNGIGNHSNPPTMSTIPSELEQSVSLTLLKLAESPSKLFSGLSSFFGTNPSTAIMANHNEPNQYPPGSNAMSLGQPQYPTYESTLIHQSQQHQQLQQPMHTATMNADSFSLQIRPPIPSTNATVAAAAVDNTTGQQRKSQSSLLDDHEETPMEQRMRSLHQFA